MSQDWVRMPAKVSAASFTSATIGVQFGIVVPTIAC
jgi:hypothetical protein